ncbi:hypothetical protein [Microvirga tunisiensis]|uniref:Uncharacterized protein n=1 Tax=Microvirga tunisiensis TaxID=2108360 RepID=A0A5N7MP36_9HYPH|nr:hypothetical protein [Microvirga tunisiensis]MPR09222.1 hypothetical protein [Microvirga tunisiensis]MPR28791.1 hypothetical protein [Microvirga tunisiensis]
MIGKVCLSAFIALMALGATCEDATRLNTRTIARCIDPRKIDFQKKIDTLCETFSSVAELANPVEHYERRHMSSSPGTPVTHPWVQTVSTSSPSSGAKVINIF